VTRSEKIYNSVLELIGDTPVVRLNRLPAPEDAEVLAKVESFNPGGSVKDRIALNMVLEAEKSGALAPGQVIVEPTSGNTGIGLALVAAVKGYRCILTMPETMSIERRNILTALGAEIILTRAEEGMEGAIAAAEKIVEEQNAFMPQQFQNPANPQAHRRHTAEEIWRVTGGKLDAFVAGVGTGGTITGVGEVLKARNERIRVIAVEPAASPVLSGGEPGAHRIQGIGAGFIPDILNREIIDEVRTVDDQAAYEMAGRLAREEGLLCGISSGAAVVVALAIAKEIGPGGRVVTLLPDTGERYFSLAEYF